VTITGQQAIGEPPKAGIVAEYDRYERGGVSSAREFNQFLVGSSGFEISQGESPPNWSVAIG
jgi:hypothetical protein